GPSAILRIMGGRQRLAALDVASSIGTSPAVASTPAARMVVGLVIGITLGARLFGEQRLPVGDRNLVVVGMDFGKRQEPVTVAAVIDEGRLQGRLNAGHLGEIDVTAKLLAGG